MLAPPLTLRMGHRGDKLSGVINGWAAFSMHFAAAILAAGRMLGQEPHLKTARIEGEVLDPVSRQPVRKAAVIIRERSQRLEGIVAPTYQNRHSAFAGLA